MPFTPRTTTDEERAPRTRKASDADLRKTRYHHKSADPDNPCPDRHNKICSRDGLPHIRHRPVG
jgi:hypothetical protein